MATSDLQSRRTLTIPKRALDAWTPRRSPFRWRRSSSVNTTSQEDPCCRRFNRFYSWQIRCPYFWASTSLSSKFPTGKAPGPCFFEPGGQEPSEESIRGIYIIDLKQVAAQTIQLFLWEAETGNLWPVLLHLFPTNSSASCWSHPHNARWFWDAVWFVWTWRLSHRQVQLCRWIAAGTQTTNLCGLGAASSL